MDDFERMLRGNINHNPPNLILDVNAINPSRGGQVCVHCGARWSGRVVCHCSKCHATFSGVALFDKHRREEGEHGYCLKPVAFRNMVFRDGMWRGPEMTEENKRARFGNG